MYAYAHNSQPLSELNVFSHEIVIHTQPGIPLTSDLNHNRKLSKSVFLNNALNFQNTLTMTKRIYFLSFTKLFQNLCHNGLLQ